MIYMTCFSKIRNLPAGIVPVSISLWPPKGYRGLRYPLLAPSKSILTEYKNSLDWDRYVRRFNEEILQHLDPYDVLADIEFMIGRSNDPALTCFELDHTHCHRTLVAKWLEKAGCSTHEYGSWH